jgi:hypothetical protein
VSGATSWQLTKDDTVKRKNGSKWEIDGNPQGGHETMMMGAREKHISHLQMAPLMARPDGNSSWQRGQETM